MTVVVFFDLNNLGGTALGSRGHGFNFQGATSTKDFLNHFWYGAFSEGQMERPIIFKLTSLQTISNKQNLNNLLSNKCIFTQSMV